MSVNRLCVLAYASQATGACRWSREAVVHSDDALHTLLKADPERGWRAFMEQYTPTLVALIERSGVVDKDDQTDVYVRVCERLVERQCSRLKQYDPSKGALAAWLTIVVRHVVVDWIRSRAGRRRLFAAVEKLDELDRRVFELYYWERYRVSEIVELVGQAADRPVSIADVFDAFVRIERALSNRHRSQLLAVMARSAQTAALDADGRSEPIVLVDRRPDPETALRVQRLDRALAAALAGLPAEDASIIRLLFLQGWARHEVQRALHLTQLTRERISDILVRLREALEARGIGADGARLPGLAFLEDETT